MSEQNISGEIYAFFEETRPIFEETKKYTVLIDKLSEGQQVPLVPINELRGSMFHLYKILRNPANKDAELLEAREHMFRACFDTYSIICSILINKISESIKGFDTSIIVEVFPNYYKVLKPQVIAIQTEIGEMRSNRETNVDLDKNGNSEERQNQVKFLLTLFAQVESMIPALENYRQEKEKKKIEEIRNQFEKERRDRKAKLLDRGLWLVGGVILAAIGIYLRNLFGK